MMTDQLKYHLERQEDLEACCQLLSNVLEVLYRKDVVSRAHGPPGARRDSRTPRLGCSTSVPKGTPWSYGFSTHSVKVHSQIF